MDFDYFFCPKIKNCFTTKLILSSSSTSLPPSISSCQRTGSRQEIRQYSIYRRISNQLDTSRPRSPRSFDHFISEGRTAELMLHHICCSKDVFSVSLRFYLLTDLKHAQKLSLSKVCPGGFSYLHVEFLVFV